MEVKFKFTLSIAFCQLNSTLMCFMREKCRAKNIFSEKQETKDNNKSRLGTTTNTATQQNTNIEHTTREQLAYTVCWDKTFGINLRIFVRVQQKEWRISCLRRSHTEKKYPDMSHSLSCEKNKHENLFAHWPAKFCVILYKKKVYTTTEPERRFEFEEDKLLLFFFVAFFSRTICDAMVMFMHFANLTLFRSCCCCYWNSLLHSLVVVLQLLYHQTFNNMLTLSPFSSTSLLSSLPCVLCVYRIRNCTFYFFEWKFNSSSSSSCYLLFD